MESMIRLLRADEIECRVAMINGRGAILLLYKDARADQKILDETFTPFGWKRTHQIIDGNLYCTVEVWDAQKDQWIAKQDVGTVSFTEKEKGQASDSFKRACVNWGIGRELYTAPFIWIPAGSMKIQKKGEKYVTTDRFEVKSIGYNANREIVSLEIVNASGAVVYQKTEAADTKPLYLVPEDFATGRGTETDGRRAEHRAGAVRAFRYRTAHPGNLREGNEKFEKIPFQSGLTDCT